MDFSGDVVADEVYLVMKKIMPYLKDQEGSTYNRVFEAIYSPLQLVEQLRRERDDLQSQITALKGEIDQEQKWSAHMELPLADCDDPNCRYHGVGTMETFTKMERQIADLQARVKELEKELDERKR